MANEKEIEEQRQRLEKATRAELLHEQARWKPHAAPVVAATQLLGEMDQREDWSRHSESLSAAYHANRLSRWAIAIAVVAGLVAGTSLYFQILDRVHRATLAPPASASPPSISRMDFTGLVASSLVVTSVQPTNTPTPKQ